MREQLVARTEKRPGAKEKDESRTTCTVRFAPTHCRLLKHSRKSPPTGMRFTEDFTRIAPRCVGRESNSEVGDVSSRTDCCDE